MTFDQMSSGHDRRMSLPNIQEDNMAEVALGLASEAVKNAAVAVSKATEALVYSKSQEMPANLKAEGPAPSEMPAFRPRASSLPRKPITTLPPANLRSRQSLKLNTTSSISESYNDRHSPTATPSFSRPLSSPAIPPAFPRPLSSPATTPPALPRPLSSPATPPAIRASSLCHVDLIDAAEAFKPQEASSASASTNLLKRNYEEDVADRNISGFFPLTFTYPLTSSPPSEIDTLDAILIASATNPKFSNKPREIAFVFSIVTSNLLTQAGLSQSIAPMPMISGSFHDLIPAKLSWYAAAYTLSVGTFILPAGRLGDIYGHKRLYLVGWLWFGLFSILAGFAPLIELSAPNLNSEVFFCFCRAMQGIGPALLLPNALAILGRTYEDGNKRNVMFAVFGAMAPTGFVLGCVFSSLISEMLRWPFAYWILGVVCFIMAALGWAAIPSQLGKGALFPGWLGGTRRRERVGWKTRWRQLDGNGVVLGVAGLVLVDFSWNQAPVVGWETPYTYFILILGIIILLAFFVIESKARSPLLPLKSISHDAILVLACIGAGWSSFGIWVFYTWKFLLTTHHLPPFTTAIMFVPAAISGIFAAMSTGLLFNKLGPQLLLFLSMLAFCIGSLLTSLIPINQIYWAQTFLSIVLVPWGMDMSFPSAAVLISDCLKREDRGVSASLVMSVVMYSISVGLGVAGTVERSLVGEHVDLVWGYRCVFFVAVGLSGFGVLVAGLALLMKKVRRRHGEC